MARRTQNDDGTFSTRCLHCLMTIASGVAKEEELAQREANHICPEKMMAELEAQKREPTS